MKSVTINIQFNDLSKSKQLELQEMIETLCEDSEFDANDDAFELYVDVTFYADGSHNILDKDK